MLCGILINNWFWCSFLALCGYFFGLRYFWGWSNMFLTWCGVRWPVFVYCVLGTIWKSYACTIRKRSYCIAFIIMVCDLYFNSHILLCLCITLILILYIISIKCVYVREYYEYSLTAIKSLLLLLLWEHLISVHSQQHPTSLLLATHLLLQLLLITVTVIHWIMAHMTLQAYILLVVCLLYKELQHTALRTL